FRACFIAYAGLAMLAALLYSRLSRRVEVQQWSGTVDQSVHAAVAEADLCACWALRDRQFRHGVDRPESGIVLVLYAFRAPTWPSRGLILRIEYLDRDLAVGCRPPRQAHRTAQHDGVYAHPVQSLPDGGAVRPRSLDGGSPLVTAGVLRADG